MLAEVPPASDTFDVSTSEPPRPESSSTAVTPRLRRLGSGWWQFVLVLLALAALSVLPLLTQQRIDALRTEINDRADRGLSELATITIELALEAAARRGYVLTQDPQIAASVTASRVRRAVATEDLEELTTDLDPSVDSARHRFVGRLATVDAQLDSLLAHGLARLNYTTGIDGRESHFTSALAAADSLRWAIQRAADDRRAAIADIERIDLILTVVLALLGVAAALAAAWLAFRLRTSALAVEGHAVEREGLLERERTARETAEARRQQLERVTESRTRLMRGFTHDVKNPLGAADGHLALLEEGIRGELSPDQRETIQRSRRSIAVALDLIRQLLDLARAESGGIAQRRERVDLPDIVGDVVEAFLPSAQSKGISVDVDATAALPEVVSDAARIRQVLANLVSNAVKYTPEGGHVHLRTMLRNDGAPGPGDWAVIEVADTGRGIAAEHLPMLFQEFTRFDPAAAEGSGIGLAISERLARALGGAITAESVLGEGSRFTLWLPLRSH